MERRRDSGQTSTSYLGLVLVAVAAVAAVLAVGVPRLVGAGLDRAVCAILRSSGCGAPNHPAEVADPSGRTPLEVATGGTYVAIGDSFSSGEGTGTYAPDTDVASDRCHRSPTAYSRLIADRLHFEGGTTFVACSGARTRDVLRRGQHGEAPQIRSIDAHTSLVTIGIGGNDAGWAELVLRCATGPDHECLGGEDEATVAMAAAAEQAAAVYAAARARAPEGARIIAVGYPRFFPRHPEETQYGHHVQLCPVPGCSFTTGFSPAEQRHLNDLTRRFNRLLADRAAEAGVEFVDLTDAYEGHEFGTDDPYLNGVELQWPTVELSLSTINPFVLGDKLDVVRDAVASIPASETFHPNRKGQQAAARLVRRQVEAP